MTKDEIEIAIKCYNLALQESFFYDSCSEHSAAAVARNIAAKIKNKYDLHLVVDGVVNTSFQDNPVRKDVIYYDADGKMHNVGDAAVVISGGMRMWYHHGKLHRTDGPAVEYATGTKAWWVNGKQLTEKQFFQWRKDNGYC